MSVPKAKHTQKPRAMKFALACFVRRSREDLASRIGWAPRVCTGGKCYGFTANSFTSPGRTSEGYRQNGGRAESAIPPLGKVLRFHGKLIHFPPPKEYDIALADAFLKIPGATANCLIYAKFCKSIYYTAIS